MASIAWSMAFRNFASLLLCVFALKTKNMNKERKLIIAGNWKMNKTVAEALALVNDLKRDLASVKEVDVVVCPPYTALESVSKSIIDSNLRLGAQNMSENSVGAFTGEIAAVMLKEFSVRYVILGHSERRQYQKESDALIARKAAAVHAAALKPIVCVGETLAEREGSQTEKVLDTQVRGSLAGLTREQMVETVIAYEPVWAIGTGKTATTQQAQDAHAFIRGLLVKLFDDATARKVRIQYGGSVKPNNAKELMSQPDVDGALVGGASLEARSFADIVKNSI
jgi:triosephosphate isomerase